MDVNTDSRHISSTTLEEEKQKESSAEEHLASEKELEDNTESHPPEQKEFAVPVLSALHRRKTKQQQKVFVALSDNNKSVNIEETGKSGQVDDNNSELGRKRVSSDGGTDVQEDENNKTEENVSCTFFAQYACLHQVESIMVYMIKIAL